MNNLLPDQVRVLSSVLQSKEVLIATTLKVTRTAAADWLGACETSVLKHAGALAGKHYGFRLDVSSSVGSPLKLSHLMAATTGAGAVVNLDLQGQWVSAGVGPVTVSGTIARTKLSGNLEILAHGTYLYVVLAGEILEEYDVFDASKPPPAGIVFYRPCKQLRDLIQDHAAHAVARETDVKYWADRKKRILLASPESTEKIFQRSLLTWFRHYVVDKIRIFSETRGFGQDATDITVMTSHGDYVVEVKWMGENESGTKYDSSQVAVGIRQVGYYLDNDTRLISGAVVIYDGRPAPPVGGEAPDSGDVHSRCDTPHIVWLESETPSQKALVAVRREIQASSGRKKLRVQKRN